MNSTLSDIVLRPGKDWQFPATKSGIKVGTLTAAQKALVLAAIKTHAEDIEDINADQIIALYTSQLDETYIAYSGNSNVLNQKDYVRIDGPRVWIEYSTQNGIFLSPKHPHSVWRDLQSDYGGLGNPSSATVAANFFGANSGSSPTRRSRPPTWRSRWKNRRRSRSTCSIRRAKKCPPG